MESYYSHNFIVLRCDLMFSVTVIFVMRIAK